MTIQAQTIKEKVQPLLESNDVEFAGIFGSYARGEAHKKSDVDLLIRFIKPKSLLKIVRLENELSALLNNKVDLVTEHFLSPYIKDNVLKDLQPIYGQR